ncbi:hypothetical protein GCM10025865_31120 [Paraoerskovia sediminicola]|uniref:SseB protein N-terminal domain-containing protein n=1 Tax=Paraoerskovia sediminicola TaxID=1138587 RepID=A0ABM8G6P7_9CELL|nr:SseB family protein [Paraoerskovia sediminicola]BDZ43813.1 hypothetical protein GCM10025865_31120 [Paraoerskovia sediminicola]
MTGRALPPSSSFAGDDGSADPVLEAVIAAHAAGGAPLRDVVGALAPARVLVPVLAEAEVTEEGEHGTVDREASSGVVALESPDGRRALPVFTSVDAMARWRQDARPVPVETPRAAQSAVSESWSLLVVDPAGPHTVLIPRPAVWALGQGKPWAPAVEDGVVDPEVQAAVEAAVGGLIHVASVRAEPGRKAEVAVVLAIHSGLDRAGLDLVLSQVNASLAKSKIIGEKVDSLELRIGRAD